MSRAKPVWVPNLDAPVPTYHTWRYRRGIGDYRTLCGQLVYDPEANPSQRGLYIRTDHAEKIGQPCGRCFG